MPPRRWSGVVVGCARSTGRSLILLVVVALVLALLPDPADAQSVRTHGTERILGSLRTQRLEVRLAGGAVARGDILRFPEQDQNLDLRPRLARGTVAGLQQMPSMASRELGRGGLAGINGGYFLPRPWGAPNGLHVDRGRLLSGQAVNSFAGGGRPTGRGMVGWQQHGRLVMDRIQVRLRLHRPGSGRDPVRFSELNRQVWPDSEAHRRPNGELLLYDDRFGTAIAAPSGSTIVTVDGLAVGSSGRTDGQVAEVRSLSRATNVSVPEGRQVIVGYGARAGDLAGMAAGDPVGVTTDITPEATSPEAWSQLWGGVAGGQLLVRDGRRRPMDEWIASASFGDSHVRARQPRTAIARTAEGEVLLVTVDGRRAGWSVGLTMRELADTLLALGASDAVNLDGGGSTTMTVLGRIRNRPSETGRSVADALFVYAPRPPVARPLQSACPGDLEPVPGFTDTAGNTHAAAIDCLFAWRVTTGVTATRFAPDAPVSRAQMASFLARWIDDLAQRGTGTALPEEAPLPFVDVPDDFVHAEAIARLAAAGIIEGLTGTRFAPGRAVTREQTASLISRAVEYVTGTPMAAGRDTFIDDNGSVHEPNIDRLAGAGILTGVGGFDVRPGNPVTRGAMASIMMRATDLLVELEIAVLPGLERNAELDWPDGDPDGESPDHEVEREADRAGDAGDEPLDGVGADEPVESPAQDGAPADQERDTGAAAGVATPTDAPGAGTGAER